MPEWRNLYLLLKIFDFVSSSILILGVDLPAGRQAQGTSQ